MIKRIKILRLLAFFVHSLFVNINTKNVRVSMSSRIVIGSKFEKNIRIRSNSYFSGSIGCCSYIGENSSISGTVGRYCSIASNVNVIRGSHPIDFVSTSPVFFSTLKQCGKTFVDRPKFEELTVKEKRGITVGNDVWIGYGVTIKEGVTIGDGAIIGMGALVVKDVEPYAIVGGVPAKTIKYRFDEETIKKLLDIKWWEWDEKKIADKANCFLDKNEFISMND